MSVVGVRRERRRFPVGARPTRQPLQPEATGAVMEVTKWRPRECAGRNASERRASLEKDDVQADPTTLSGKADTAGCDERRVRPAAAPGSGGSMYTRKAYATREAPRRGQG